MAQYLNTYEKITEFNIPEGITSLGNEALGNCFNLKKLTLPKSLSSIGSFAFDGCPKTCEIIFLKPAEEITGIKNYPFGLEIGTKIITSTKDITV